ncbi:hypothetical protein OG216_47530 (plasmid) [Streptomycetaceae bacterium NBC_01309]
MTLHSRIRRRPARYVTTSAGAAEAFGVTGPLRGPHCRHGSDGRPLVDAAPVAVGPWQPLTVATATALAATLTGTWRSVGVPGTTDTLVELLHGIAACCREWVAVGDTTVLVTTLDDPVGYDGAPWVFHRDPGASPVGCPACIARLTPNGLSAGARPTTGTGTDTSALPTAPA